MPLFPYNLCPRHYSAQLSLCLLPFNIEQPFSPAHPNYCLLFPSTSFKTFRPELYLYCSLTNKACLSLQSSDSQVGGWWGDLAPRDILQCLETFLVVAFTRVLLICSGWRPGMLLNPTRHTQSPIIKNYLAQIVNSTSIQKLCYK